MKKLVFILLTFVLFSFSGISQVVEHIDYMSPFHDGYAAIKKGETWAIINQEGTIVIDYREDLVPLAMEDGKYPVFRNGRALIKEVKEGVNYYGYIDMKGAVVIEPKFINARCFKYDKAIVTKLIKEKLGYNKVMDKPVVSYMYQEVVIDFYGDEIAFVTEPEVIPNLNVKSKIPKIRSKIVSKNLVLTELDNNRVTLLKLKPKNASL